MFRNEGGALRQYLIDGHIVTVSSPVLLILLIVEEMPPFIRALTVASMDTPWPNEKVAEEAVYNVTLLESGWTPERTESFMGRSNRETMTAVAMHEDYPSHRVVFLGEPSTVL